MLWDVTVVLDSSAHVYQGAVETKEQAIAKAKAILCGEEVVHIDEETQFFPVHRIVTVYIRPHRP